MFTEAELVGQETYNKRVAKGLDIYSIFQYFLELFLPRSGDFKP